MSDYTLDKLSRHFEKDIDALLPSQSNNSGKFLKTNGETVSWDNVDSLPSQSGNSGKFLTTNGTTAAWSDILNETKISSVHYPTAEATTITLTSGQSIPSNVNKYALSIYRNGIYLNPSIDYGFNSSTGVITFAEAFGQDEIVTVIFTYINTDSQVQLDIDVDEYEAGSNITFTNNSVTGKVIISANNQLPSQTNNAGRILTTDGTNAYWQSYNKLKYTYTAESTTSTVTVPSANLSGAIITEIYRNGMLMSETEDYSVNTSTGVITFVSDLTVNERVVVVTETATAINNSVLSGATLNSSTANTPVVTDNSSSIATTAFVNNKFANPIEKVNTLTSSSSITINPSNGSLFLLDLEDNASITIGTITGPYTTNGATLSLFITNDDCTITWDSNKIIWMSGIAPDITTNPSIITFITFDGGTTWYGNATEIISEETVEVEIPN